MRGCERCESGVRVRWEGDGEARHDAAQSCAQPPTTDIYTGSDESLVIEIHLPHFREREITVRVHHGGVVVEAEEREGEHRHRRYVTRESAGELYHAISLPDHFDLRALDAVFADGILRIRVPLAGGAAARDIAVGYNGDAPPASSPVPQGPGPFALAEPGERGGRWVHGKDA